MPVPPKARKILLQMQKKHGKKKGISIFYATANKRGKLADYKPGKK